MPSIINHFWILKNLAPYWCGQDPLVPFMCMLMTNTKNNTNNFVGRNVSITDIVLTVSFNFQETSSFCWDIKIEFLVSFTRISLSIIKMKKNYLEINNHSILPRHLTKALGHLLYHRSQWMTQCNAMVWNSQYYS